ncbi:MAG TPA: hypothetical protein VGJ91_14955 [Polyangiaceae bacterium]|jgi:hypothetical protein
MARYRRCVAIILLIVFGTSMGDWPYVDEILEKLPQHDAAALSHSSVAAPDLHSRDAGTDAQLVFEVLLGLQAVMPSQTVFMAVGIERTFDLVTAPVPFSFPTPLYRPPATALPV